MSKCRNFFPPLNFMHILTTLLIQDPSGSFSVKQNTLPGWVSGEQQKNGDKAESRCKDIEAPVCYFWILWNVLPFQLDCEIFCTCSWITFNSALKNCIGFWYWKKCGIRNFMYVCACRERNKQYIWACHLLTGNGQIPSSALNLMHSVISESGGERAIELMVIR